MTEARRRFSALAEEIERTGQPIIIERRGVPQVKMRPLTEEERRASAERRSKRGA